MQRASQREGYKNPQKLGSMLGVTNPKAKDKLAREARQLRRQG
jgi:hypothetical protein